MPKRKRGLPDIASLLEGGFNEETARLLYTRGKEIAIFVMMQPAALAVKKVEVNDMHPNDVHPNDVHPSESPGSVATYLKVPPKKRRKKSGAKPGHKGSHRLPPENFTLHVTQVAKCCPDYSGKLNRRRGTTCKRYKRCL